jgi:HSP20 family molecular chaperone IbpA
VPHGVNGELAEVAYRDGVLTVILPKTEIVPHDVGRARSSLSRTAKRVN